MFLIPCLIISHYVTAQNLLSLTDKKDVYLFNLNFIDDLVGSNLKRNMVLGTSPGFGIRKPECAYAQTL